SWWGFSMMDLKSIGRTTFLSPVTWHEGWPYFGLPGNLGRSPRTWAKPQVGADVRPRAPYARSDEFSAAQLQPVWQWNHQPRAGKWSLRERPGYLRLHTLPAAGFLHARNTLTQRVVGPEATATVVMDASGLQPGDIAGLGLLNMPAAWLAAARRPGPGPGLCLLERGRARVPRYRRTGAPAVPAQDLPGRALRAVRLQPGGSRRRIRGLRPFRAGRAARRPFAQHSAGQGGG